MISTDILQSPCCAANLTRSAGTLACGDCGQEFPLQAFGPDLMPPDAAQRYAAFGTWQAVQQALTAWRARTWTGTPEAAVRSQRAANLGEAFVAWSKPRGAVLDIGCGGGWIRSLMPDAQYHGIDPMPAAQPYEFPFVRGLSDRLPFADGMFDTCCFFSSIDYAIDIDLTLSEARRVLKSGGRLAVACMVHATKAVQGEALHHYRFLDGELGRLAAQHFADVQTFAYEPGYHFVLGNAA